MAVGHESLKFRKINDEWQQARTSDITREKALELARPRNGLPSTSMPSNGE